MRRTIFTLVILLLLSMRQSSAMLPAPLPPSLIHGRAIVGVLQFQDKPAAPATNGAAAVAPAGVSPKMTQELTDLEDLAKTKSALFQSQLQAILADIMKQPNIVAAQKDANDTVARAITALVKACSLDEQKYTYDFQKRVCVLKEPEKP